MNAPEARPNAKSVMSIERRPNTREHATARQARHYVQTRITKLEQRRSAGNVAWFAGERKVRSELASFALADFRVQLCVDLALHQISMANETAPATMGAAFDSLAALGTIDVALAQRMKNAVGFRNLAVHQYEAMDWQIVHAICTRNLDDFRAFAKAIHS